METEELITEEEIQQFYTLAKKMQKLALKEQQDTEKPTLIKVRLDIDLIKEGTKINIADELIEKLGYTYELPLKNGGIDAQVYIDEIIDGITLHLQKIMRKS